MLRGVIEKLVVKVLRKYELIPEQDYEKREKSKQLVSKVSQDAATTYSEDEETKWCHYWHKPDDAGADIRPYFGYKKKFRGSRTKKQIEKRNRERYNNFLKRIEILRENLEGDIVFIRDLFKKDN